MDTVLCLPAGQKRAPDLITDCCEPPCGCWELNSEPLEEPPVLLTAEPSLQPCLLVFEIHSLGWSHIYNPSALASLVLRL